MSIENITENTKKRDLDDWDMCLEEESWDKFMNYQLQEKERKRLKFRWSDVVKNDMEVNI